MSRKIFLTLASIVTIGVGLFALSVPAILLDSKGAAGSAAADVWVREIGIALISIGIVAFGVRGHADSPTLRTFLFGNAILQLGLFTIEVVAYAQGVITKVSGIIPNAIVHVLLFCGFMYYATSRNTDSNHQTEKLLHSAK